MRHPLGCATWIGAVICVVSLTGCASAPQYRYYTIDMQPRSQLTPAVNIGVLRVKVNEALLRPEILIRTSPTQIEYYALDRWASGLDEQVAEKLRTEFSAAAPDAHSLVLNCSVMGFEQVDSENGTHVRVKLEMSAESITFHKVYFREEAAAAATAPAVVEALSRATEAIAVELAEDLDAAVKKVQ